MILSDLKSSIACGTSARVSVPSQSPLGSGVGVGSGVGSKGALWVTWRTGEMQDMPPLMVHKGSETVSYQLLVDLIESFNGAALDFIDGILTDRQPDDGHTLHRGCAAHCPCDGTRRPTRARGLRLRKLANDAGMLRLRHPITNAGLGEDVPRLTSVVSQLAAKVSHCGAKQLQVAGVPWSPDPV